VLSGGGTLEPFSVDISGDVVTLSGDGKCQNGAVFVPPGFNITLTAIAPVGTTLSVTMNTDPAYTCHAVINVDCTALTPLTQMTNTTIVSNSFF
jgi:hypothetical protein